MTFKVICRKEIIYKNSTSPLCLLFFQGKRKKAVGLGVSVALKHWDAEAQKVTDDCPDRDNIQFQITAKVKEYEKKIQRLEIMDIPVTPNSLILRSFHLATRYKSEIFVERGPREMVNLPESQIFKARFR